MSNNFCISYGRLDKYWGSDVDVIIPDGVTCIGDHAFSFCINVESICIPDSVKWIAEYAFQSCHNLESINIPDSVEYIGVGAFCDCYRLSNINIPDSVKFIGNNAFLHCHRLTLLSFPKSDCKVSIGLFGKCLPQAVIPCIKDLYMCFSDGILKRYVLEQTVWSKLDEELQMEIFINRHSKAFRETYSKIIENPHKLGEMILGRISEDASVDDCECAVSFLHTFYDALAKDEIMVQLYNALKPLKNARKLLKSIEKNPELCAILNIAIAKPIEQNLVLCKNEQILLDVLKSENKTTDFVSDMVKEYYGLSYSRLPKVCFADGEKAPDFALAYLLTVHEESYVSSGEKERRIRPAYEKPGICENAQKVVTLLDPKDLQRAIMHLAEWNLTVSRRSKRMYLAFPICRYADDDTMNELIRCSSKWCSSVLYTFYNACIYNECRSVIIFADKIGYLSYYARIRGTDEQTIRDTVMADFGFDEEGKKQYNLGGTTIIVTFEKDCSFSLFDTKNNKTVKSMPKRGNDEALVAAAAKDFSELKKNVKKVIKNRFAQLFSAFLDETEQKAENWKKAYIGNPVLRAVANTVVWKQDKNTFILKDDKAICADGTPYTIGDSPILVAHPMEMNQEELSAWKAYFLNNSLKQAFEQIWEPVISPNEVQKDRYAGISIPFYYFMNKDKHGISIEYGEEPEFPMEPSIYFEDCDLDWHWANEWHDVTPSEVIEIKKFVFSKYTRQVNHIVAYLDKAVISGLIEKDDVSVANYLHNLTLAQVMKFIDLATQKNSSNVSAILLDYKNKNFPGIDPMSEFTLADL